MRLTKDLTNRLQDLLNAMLAAEQERNDSDARDEYEAVATDLAGLLIVYGFRPRTAERPHSERR